MEAEAERFLISSKLANPTKKLASDDKLSNVRHQI